jgi:multidrug efflux pump subunit AcrA (membrane-fusion protein)
MTKRFIIFNLLLLALLFVAGCALLPGGEGRDRGQSLTVQQGPTPTPVPTPIVPTKPTYKVERGDVIELEKFSGRIAPVEEAELFFRTGGWVRNVYVERDDFVEAGQVLADLEIDDLERDLESRNLDLERVQSVLDAAEEDLAIEVRRAEVDKEIVELRLAQTRDRDLSPRQQQAAAELEKSYIALKQAQEDYDAIAWRNDRASRGEADRLQQATLDHLQAKAAYDLAIQDIDNLKYDVAILEREIELAQIKLDELMEGVDPLLINDVKQAQLTVEKLEAAIADAQIIAPFAGQVTSESLTEGREVTPHKTVVILADMSEMELTADPGTNQLENMVEGMAVEAYRANTPGERYTGTIRRLPYPYGGGGRSEGVEDTQEDKSTRILLDVDLTETNLEIGDLMSIEVVIEQKQDVLWLPPQAIRKFEGRKFVVVLDGEVQRRVDVTTGIESTDRVEIEEGLSAGQTVIAP